MNKEKVRCINSKTNRVMFHPPHLAFDKSWQKRTGFFPEPILDESVKAASIVESKPSAEKKDNAQEHLSEIKTREYIGHYTEPNMLTEDMDDPFDGSEIGSEIGSENMGQGKPYGKTPRPRSGKIKSSHI